MVFMKNIINKLFSSVISRLSVFLVQMLSLLVLSRLVSVEAFGVFALINGVCFLLMMLAEFGVTQSIINKKDSCYQLLYEFSLKVSAFFSISTPLFLYLLTIIFDIELTLFIYIAIPIIVFLFGVTSICLGDLNKRFQFKLVAVSETAAELIALVAVMLVISIYGASYEVLVLKVLIFSITRALLITFYFKKQCDRRDLIFKLSFSIGKIESFNKGVVLSNLASFLVRQGDNFLVGKLFGIVMLGLYDRAYQLVKYPVMLLSFSLQPALQPIMRTVDCYTLFRKIIIATWLLCILAGLSLTLIFNLYSNYIINIILGAGWEEIDFIVKILSYSIAFQCFFSLSGGFFYAIEVSGKNALVNTITFILISLSFYIGYINESIKAGLYLVTISFFIVSVICLLLLLKEGKQFYKKNKLENKPCHV